MPARVFKEEEKREIKEKLLSVGFPMLKEYGLVHMSIPKIAKAAGIGTGTFYRFFESKEEYIYQLICYHRNILLSEVVTEDIRNGKRKLSREEVRRIIELMIDKEKSVYVNLTLKDEARLYEHVHVFFPDIEKEKSVAGELMSLIDNPKKEIDFPVLANLIKILVLTAQAKDELHKEGYERTVSLLIETILDEIYDMGTVLLAHVNI